MAIRRINAKRDDSQANVNPRFHTEDGRVVPIWSITNELDRKEYYLTPEVSEWKVLEAARTGQPIPAGYVVTEDETIHTGRVCAVETREERIMSDVWENVTRALVFSPETKGQKMWQYGPEQTSDYMWVHVQTTGNYLTAGFATVDADPALLVEYNRIEKEKADALQKRLADERAAAIRHEVCKGKIVKVNRGRKVAKGTTGKVFWIGENSYGRTVGIALTPRLCQKAGRNGRMFDSYVDVVFVSMANVDVVGSESDAALAAALEAWEKG